MKDFKISFVGFSDGKGNFRINPNAELKSLSNNWPNAKFMVTVELMSTSSDAINGYYYKKIVPSFQDAYRRSYGERYSLNDVDLKLREMCPISMVEIPKEETGGFELVRYRAINEMNDWEASEYISHLKQIAAEKFDFYIDDNTN